MAQVNRVVIVGGGVGGLTTALALKNAGVEVEVHEKYDHLAGRATGFTLWSYAIKILQGLGLDDPTRIGQPIEFTEPTTRRVISSKSCRWARCPASWVPRAAT